jgi:hypothetical protein
MSNPVANLLHAQSDVSACDVAGLGEKELLRLVQEIRQTDRALTSLKVNVAQAIDALAAEGHAAPASEALLGQGQVSAGTARREAERSRTAAALPAFGDALANGSIDGEHLDAVGQASKRLNDVERMQFCEEQERLARLARNTPVDAFRKTVNDTVNRIRDDHGLAEAERQRRASEFRMWEDRTGMGQIRGSLGPDQFAAFVQAIEAETASLAAAGAADGSPLAKSDHLRSQALMSLVGHGNGAKGRAHVIVVTDQQTLRTGPHPHSLRETVDGIELPPETIARHCCDAVLQRVVVDPDGVALEVGRARRTATPGQWAALRAMYRTCAWSGCDRPVSWCQAHHIVEWDNGGPTDLDNLLPLCTTHHHAVHEGQWTVKLLPDRTLHIVRPDGVAHASTRPDRPPARMGLREHEREPSNN